MVTWEYYINRGRRNVSRWMERNQIKSYKELCLILERIKVTPPARSKVNRYFVKKSVVLPPAPRPKDVPKDAPKDVPKAAETKHKKQTKRTTKKSSKK